MKMIKTPYRKYPEDYINVVSNMNRGDRKDILLSMQGLVGSRYDEYKRSFDSSRIFSLATVGFSSDESKHLKSMYTSGNATLTKIKQHILDIQDADWKNLCAYCGIEYFGSYDHYLPKDFFPEYSIFAINLIRCCNQCNTKKSTYWKDVRGRGVINPYLDDLSSIEFLLCTITYSRGVPVASFSLLETGSDFLDDLISKHFERLDLLKRYQGQSNTEISTIRDDLDSYSPEHTPELLRNILKARYDREVVRFGRSYWRCAIRKALYESDDFIDDFCPS